ncbi:hypothetical protein, partial [Thiolapillus sp.]|uniref:hypothetical protein n=1 Tax=Thiolapillus sp. TaxID=2017437 RepID=UPI0035ABE526
RPRKYGTRLGSASELAASRKTQAKMRSVFLYGKQREVLAYLITHQSRPFARNDTAWEVS